MDIVYLCTTDPLSKQDVDLLKRLTRELYQVNMVLHDLPAMRYVKWSELAIRWKGFPVGYTPFESEEFYIINRLKFQIQVNQADHDGSAFVIVGFQVVPCSVKYDPEKMMKLIMYGDDGCPINCPSNLQDMQTVREGERVSFTYEVEFVKSDIKWSNRWNVYLMMEDDSIHWFSIMNSLITILILAGVILWRFWRTIRRAPQGYQGLDKETRTKEEVDALGNWNHMVGHLFKAPKFCRLFAVIVGTGIQITGMAVLTATFAAIGFMPPASRGALLLGTLSFYIILGFAGGYAGVCLWKTTTGSSEGWKNISWSIACFVPGIVFLIQTMIDLILWHSNSTGAVPISAYLKILSLWLCVLVPLTFLGGYMASRAEAAECPTLVNWSPRRTGARKFLLWLLTVAAGILPSGVIYIELYFIFSSIWLGRFYYAFGFLLIVLLLFLITSGQVSMLIACSSLRAEDPSWWWKAFCASASSGLYVLLYCINYLVFDLRGLSGCTSRIIYLGYSSIIVIATTLAAGSIGSLVSFFFLRLLS